MLKRIFGIGDASFSGRYHSMRRIGDLNLDGAELDILRAIGDISLKNCRIKNVKVIGDIAVDSSIMGRISMIGDVDLSGCCKAGDVVMLGDFDAESLECRAFRAGFKKFNKVNGRPSLSGYIKAVTYEHFYDTEVNADLETENTLTAARFQKSDVECKRLYAFGIIDIDNISADYIYIKPFDTSKAGCVAGGTVIISDRFRFDRQFKSIPKTVPKRFYKNAVKLNSSIMNIGTIEADSVSINNVKADTVCGKNVEIGDLCIINRVEYTGILNVSKKAIVNEIVKG